MYKKVLLPVSDKVKERSLKGLHHAMSVCEEELILLHVCPQVPNIVGGHAREELKKSDSAEAEHLLAEFVEKASQNVPQCRVRIEHGDPADCIVKVADEENVDLIVMFTDGRDCLSDVLLGSVTERVLRDTAVTLLAVRR